MRRTINVFTSLIFIYSLVVCIACKQVSPDKVGNLELDALSLMRTEKAHPKQTKQKTNAEEIQASASAFMPSEMLAE